MRDFFGSDLTPPAFCCPFAELFGTIDRLPLVGSQQAQQRGGLPETLLMTCQRLELFPQTNPNIVYPKKQLFALQYKKNYKHLTIQQLYFKMPMCDRLIACQTLSYHKFHDRSFSHRSYIFRAVASNLPH